MSSPHARPMLVAKNGEASHRSRSVSVRPFPLSPCLMFVHLYLVLDRVPPAVTSVPSAVQINLPTNVRHALRLFFRLTICACGMTTHDCTLTRIAMFVYSSPLNMPHECRLVRITMFGGRKGRIGNVAWEDSRLEMRGV
jgi:hypothetical protein